MSTTFPTRAATTLERELSIPEETPHMANHLREIADLGQAVWLDNISRQLVEDGGLERLISEDGLTGVTSNPTIFEKAIGGSDRYDDALNEAASRDLDARG